MKPPALTFSSVLACLLLSVAALLATEPWSKARISTSRFEVRAQSDRSGLVQLYYDTGDGMSEPASVLLPIEADHPGTLRFALPYGRFRALRLDPLDRDARVTISGARIADGSGRTLVAFAPGQFQGLHDIRSLFVQGSELRIETEPGATDPQLWINLKGPFTIERPSLWGEAALVFGCALMCLAVLGWAWGSPRLGLPVRAASLWAAAGASPGCALAAAALLATLTANFPVAFGGRSLVSPNIGVALLYGQSPWLPGNANGEVGDAHSADVDALMWQYVPWSVVERRALVGDGELPLWDRYDSAGVPLLGQGQSCLGDPLHLIPILASGAAWAWDLKFLLAKWIFAAATGLCAWRLFRHLPTALLTAASAPFLGFFIYRINHPAIFSVCYAPLIVYAWLRCLDSRSARSAAPWLAALIGANWMEMNSGTAKEAYILLLSMNFTGLCLLLLGMRPPREKAALLCALAGAGVLFAMISAPVWYTFYRALGASYTSYGSAESFQVQPGMLLGLFDEAFYRPFQAESGVINPSANIYILLGLAWAAVRWRQLLADKGAAALLVSALPALALVFGVVPPGLIARVPFLRNIMHVDNTFSCALIVVLCILSGFGWEAGVGTPCVGREKEGGSPRCRVACHALLRIPGDLAVRPAERLRAAHLGQADQRGALRPRLWVEPRGGGGAPSLGPRPDASARGRDPGHAPLRLDGLRGASLARGAPLGWELCGLCCQARREGRPPRPSPAVAAVRARADSPSRAVGFHNDLLPGWSGVYGVEGISGPDALMNPYYRELMDTAGVTRVWDWRYSVEAADLARVKPVLDLLNVRDYLGYRLGGARPGPELERVASADMDVYESREAWPRAFFTDSVAVYRDAAQFCSWVAAGDGRPFAGIQLGDWTALTPAPRVSGDLAKRRVNAAQGYRLTSNSTSFTVSATGPGFIVLSEAYEKGNFRATVNGRPAPYLRVNHAFKGVYVDSAGTYEVRFEYWPAGLSASLAVSAAGLALAALALLLAIGIRPTAGAARIP